MSWGPFDLGGCAAIVTGAAKGIGFGIARRFVEAGACVLLADADEKAVFDAVKRLEVPPDRAAPMHVDVSSKEAGAAMVARCVKWQGKVDALVNNAGIYPQTPMLKMTPEQFERVWRINTFGLAFASKAAALQMVQQGHGGSILNISSVDALHPSMVGLAAYDASKGSVHMFTRSLALELAPHRIRVNEIAPGGVATEGTAKPLEGSGMTAEQMAAMMDGFVKTKIPMGRMGEPDDIATAAVFLTSPAARYVTGSYLVVDGGMLLA